MGGSEKNTSGVDFVATMPTEEVYTMPKKNGVNGTVINSKPLVYNGNLIDNFRLTFKDGKVDELKHFGVNDSLIHEDFMIGTGDLEITGVTADGKHIPIFTNGSFAR